MWWRRKAASHRTGYEFANNLRKVLNLEYYDFTKDKGELYKTHIERIFIDLEYKHNNFYATLTTPAESREFCGLCGGDYSGKRFIEEIGLSICRLQ